MLRLGYYDDRGARMIAANLQPAATDEQPLCVRETTGTGLVDCGNWAVSLTWTVPSTAVSGLYIARLERNDTQGASAIAFVVRDDAAHSDVVLQTSDATWTAYNVFGGNSLYQCQESCPPGNPLAYRAATKVSYNRPLMTQGMEGPFYSEYPLIRFMEANGYDVSYVSEVDAHRDADLLQPGRARHADAHADAVPSAERRARVLDRDRQLAPGLDNASSLTIPMDRNMQQMTVNVFADDGVQPQTPIAGIVPASPSTDEAAPSSTIASPSREVFADGAIVTISGTASDGGGGVVAGVEVSADGGETWHPATGTTSWRYDWTVHGAPSVALRSRAVDDSGNLETPGAGVTVDVSCPCSVFGLAEPLEPDSGDGTAAELGVKLQAATAGSVEAIRFYKSSLNTGTHSASLWTSAGTRLAQATFTDESSSGWQTVTFANPVAIAPGTTYVASYYAPRGHYSATTSGLATSIVAAPLRTVANSASPNGVYAYGTASSFPINAFRANNYWVDVTFVAGS